MRHEGARVHRMPAALRFRCPCDPMDDRWSGNGNCPFVWSTCPGSHLQAARVRTPASSSGCLVKSFVTSSRRLVSSSRWREPNCIRWTVLVFAPCPSSTEHDRLRSVGADRVRRRVAVRLTASIRRRAAKPYARPSARTLGARPPSLRVGLFALQYRMRPHRALRVVANLARRRHGSVMETLLARTARPLASAAAIGGTHFGDRWGPIRPWCIDRSRGSVRG